MSIAGKLPVIASFIISISVQPGRPINLAVCIRRDCYFNTQDGNRSAVLKNCLYLETQMIEIVQIVTGSRP